MIVEIWLKSDEKKDREYKKELYQKHGVREFWQVCLTIRKVSVEVLNENGKYMIFSEAEKEGVVQSKILEGFEISVSHIF